VRNFAILFILFLFTACAKNTVEKTDEAIDVALSLLSDGKCQKAIDILDDAGFQSKNAVYLQVLASAYACKANFDEVVFIDSDLGSMVTTNGKTIVKSLAAMSLSDETEADSSNYVAIRTGINYMLNSTSGAPSQVARDTKFGERKSGELGIYALVLNLVNLGKFLQYYGNTDAAGVKGNGTAANNCFIDYNDPRAKAMLSAPTTGACLTFTDGHADLDQSTATGKRRMCEGIVLLTNTIDILENMDFSGSSTFSKMTDVATQVATFKAAATAVGLGAIVDMTKQSDCEAYANVPAQLLDLEYFYAVVFEANLQ
jgi:hypothetical protein